MCNSACIQFAKNNLKESDIKGKNVIEVGSLDINGTLRPIIEVFKPALYTGVDLFEGPGVDIVCDAKKLIDIFGQERFDLLTLQRDILTGPHRGQFSFPVGEISTMIF